MIGYSGTNPDFVIFPGFFDIYIEIQEEIMPEFVRYGTPILKTDIKGLSFVSVHFFQSQ